MEHTLFHLHSLYLHLGWVTSCGYSLLIGQCCWHGLAVDNKHPDESETEILMPRQPSLVSLSVDSCSPYGCDLGLVATVASISTLYASTVSDPQASGMTTSDKADKDSAVAAT